jgi:diaminohydroxyphosphoribosylaminopyrimidine deaminase/5-amino-6-(5-phosphoribosylamino)uracil reductase
MVQADRTSEGRAWACLRALAKRAAQGRPLVAPATFDVDDAGRVQELPVSAGHAGFISISPSSPKGFSVPSGRALDPASAQLLSMFLPHVLGRDSAQLVVAHLGQSADGYAATFCGRNKFITGQDDIRHTHRMRALFDVVLVGASTVEIDDPQLTTRLVKGESPVRVVLDPRARLQAKHRVFTDESAHTLVVTEPGRHAQLPAHVEHMEVPRTAAGMLDLEELLQALRARGLSRIFIEGGALTIAHFLRAKLLHRLQLAVAPVILGPGPALPAHRLSPRALPALGQTRSFNLGDDTLFETALRAAPLSAAAPGA